LVIGDCPHYLAEGGELQYHRELKKGGVDRGTGRENLKERQKEKREDKKIQIKMQPIAKYF